MSFNLPRFSFLSPAFVLLSANFYTAMKTFFQRNKGFCAFDSFDLLQFIMKDCTQLAYVLANNFSKNAVVASCVVHANNFRDLFQVFSYCIIQGTFFKIDTTLSMNLTSQK